MTNESRTAYFLRGSTSTIMDMILPSSSPELTAQESPSNFYDSSAAGRQRLLGEEDGETGKDAPFTFMLTALIILVVIFFILCGYHIMRFWFCKIIFGVEADPVDNVETVLVHDGQIFSLSPQQRRAVLEAIFSGSSKAVTDQDVVAKKKVKRKKKRSQDEAENEEDEFGDLVEPLPFDAVEIPAVTTVATDLESDRGGSSSPTNVPQAISMAHTSTIESPGSCVEDDLSDVDGGSVVDNDAETSNVQPDDQTLSPSSAPEKVFNERDAPTPPIENAPPDCNFGAKEESTEDRLSHVLTSPNKEDVFFDRSSDDALQLPRLGDESPQAFSFDGDNIESNDEKNAPYHREASDESENTPLRLSKLKAVDPGDLPTPEHDVSDKGNLTVPEPVPVPARTLIVTTSVEIGEEEECKEEIQDPYDVERAMSADDSLGDLCVVPTADPYSFANRQSFAAASVTSEYTFDDESTITGENVCPICLGGYKQGDMLVVSKNCCHAFHKNCLLEWLEKHDDCPNCRATMVTDSEINRAAPTVVGNETLTYRTVRTPRPPTSSHSWLAPQANLGSLRNPNPRANSSSARQTRAGRRPVTRASGSSTPTRRGSTGIYYQNRDAYA